MPSDCVGYVTGNRRETLGKMEEEWGVLMFFLDSYKDDPDRHKRKQEQLAIFGPKRQRRGAELKVMSAIEAKTPGMFTRGVREKESRSYWGTDTLLLSDSELAYGLGMPTPLPPSTSFPPACTHCTDTSPAAGMPHRSLHRCCSPNAMVVQGQNSLHRTAYQVVLPPASCVASLCWPADSWADDRWRIGRGLGCRP